MKNSDDLSLQNCFGSFCTKVLKNEARDIQRENARIREKEVSMESLYDSDFKNFSYVDKHFSHAHVFEVHGIPIVVNGDLLAEAIAQLPDREREVILLSYFLDLSDQKISEMTNVVRKTVFERRHVSLIGLRDYLEKEGYKWPDDLN